MKKIYFTLIALFLILNSGLAQTKLEKSQTDGTPTKEVPTKGTTTNNASFYKSINNWSNGTYLIFNSGESIKREYETLKKIMNSEKPTKGDQAEGEDASCFDHPALDLWEKKRGFTSMRSVYERNECEMLDVGYNPSQLRDEPILNDALMSLVSPSGLVQVGKEIQYFSETIYAKAPISQKKRLKSILDGKTDLTAADKRNGFEVTLRSGTNCNASFDLEINHTTKSAHVTYTGSPLGNGDKKITWDVDGVNGHVNETGFTESYSNVGDKTICVNYTEYDVVNDTSYIYSTTLVDSTITLASGQDSIIQVKKTVKSIVVNEVNKIVCMDTYCKTFTIGQCNADFNHVVGIDNAVHFNDVSSTPFGTITSYLWQFGDGQESTLQNPTHTYECDKEYTVTLIIKSDQCPNGQAVSTASIDATGLACCDKNPESSWKEKISPNNSKHKIKYRYDMGTNWNWLFDQDFKAKIKYYEYRGGCCFWNKNKKKWRKTTGKLDVDFDGKVFTQDEDDCNCQMPRSLAAQPAYKNAKTHTFQDDLSSSAFSGEAHWLKQTSPVYITYKVNNVTYVTQLCNDEPGFQCE